ncbi:MAG TPA: ribonuclease P protein subunit [Nitrososphaeraceae archaeon]|jgi:RNase P/RNase MRP subunit p29
MITNENLHNHELIGLHVTIQSSPLTTIRNICGKIVYETKKMLIIENDNGIKAIPKMAVRAMRVELSTGVCFISGSSLIARPEDRILRMS